MYLTFTMGSSYRPTVTNLVTHLRSGLVPSSSSSRNRR
jgi:hypothetical protein